MRKTGVCIGVMVLACAAAAQCLAQTVTTAAEADRKDLSLTLYTSGSDVVRDTRRANLPTGVIDLKFPGVAGRILPDSLQVVSVTAPARLSALGETYSYDLLNPQRLLESYAGKKLTLVLLRLEKGSQVEKPVEAMLVAANPGPVWRIDGKIETGLRVDHYVFPDVPANLDARPALILRLRNERAGEQDVRVSYLTYGLNWTANYSLIASADWKGANLVARAAINNQSGADYRNASIQLVAGQVRRVNESVPAPRTMVRGGALGAEMQTVRVTEAPQQPFSGYHIYNLPQRLDLADRSFQQLPLFSAAGIRVTRDYEVSVQHWYNQGPEPASTLKSPVELSAKFENSKANSLGVPLPPGIVRVYLEDDSGRAQLVGEDMMQGTAEGEWVTLNLGNAFDVVENGKQTDYQSVGPNTTESSYEITLRNHQSQDISVTVNEQFNGDWQILSSSLPYKKTSSTTAQFKVPVPANGSTVLKYRLRVRWVR